MSDTPTIRRATRQEHITDGIRNPADLWTDHTLDMPPGLVAQAATELWGDPEPSIAQGGRLWRLRAGEGEGCPAYISVEIGEPCVLFSMVRRHESPRTWWN